MKPGSATTADSISAVHRHEAEKTVVEDRPGLLEVETNDGASGDAVNDDETNQMISRTSDKKTDETIESQKPSGGYLWRFSSSVIGTTTGAVSGAVGLGVGGIKWMASKGYNAGSAVVDTTKTVAGKVPIPTWKKKDKKE